MRHPIAAVRGLPAGYAGAGWAPEPDDRTDPRRPHTPDPRLRRHGPWLINDHAADPELANRRAPAHGIYFREHHCGLTEWAAAWHGWPMFRWAGPRIHWTHPLVSPWNPILAQELTEDRAGYPHWPGDWEWWTARALCQGRKAGGYFGISPRREQRRWVAEHRDRLAIARIGGQRLSTCCYAAQRGTLTQVYDDTLDALSAEYRRVFTAAGASELAEDAEVDLTGHAHARLLDLAVNHEDVPAVVRGLALGYPPEVTAGTMLHRRAHPQERAYAECGAWCERTQAVTS